jgi:hypothetical protein
MANVLKMTMIEAIHSLRSAGLSCREIGRRLGVHRETVSRHLRLGGEPVLTQVTHLEACSPGFTRILGQSLHYICTGLSIRLSRRGSVRPSRWSSIFWSTSGSVTCRSLTVVRMPPDDSAGRTMSPLLIVANS